MQSNRRPAGIRQMQTLIGELKPRLQQANMLPATCCLPRNMLPWCKRGFTVLPGPPSWIRGERGQGGNGRKERGRKTGDGGREMRGKGISEGELVPTLTTAYVTVVCIVKSIKPVQLKTSSYVVPSHLVPKQLVVVHTQWPYYNPSPDVIPSYWYLNKSNANTIDAGHSIECKHTPATRSPSHMFCTLWPCGLDLWPFDLILNGLPGLTMDYPCGKCDCSLL